MSDFIEQYMERVRKRLSRREHDPIIRMAEVLCFPSFHPETLLRATHGPDGTTFRLTTFTSSLWYSGQANENDKTPNRAQEVVVVQSDTIGRFWDAVDELKPETIQTTQAIGVDGMLVRAVYREGESAISFETWSPDPTSPSGRFVHLIYDLAWEVLKEQVSIERLEQLHGYLRLGLPARFISGDVPCLRLFGSLASHHQRELQQLFGSLQDETPLVIDMTNFDGMGTLLYPTFIELASARQLLAWACSKNAKRHIESMRLSSPQVFDNPQSAIEWVKQRSN